jgi:hypothetical protein
MKHLQRYQRFYTFCILVLAAVLRLWNIGGASLWYDESFTAVISRLPYNQLLAATAGDVHPPAYYTVMHVLIGLGLPYSAGWLRLPSALFSWAAVWAGMTWARERYGLAAGLLAGALLAVWPYNLAYAQEARMYALVQFLAALGALLVQRRRYGLAGLVGVALLYTHNYGLFYVAGLALYAYLETKQYRPALVVSWGYLAWLPWLAVLLSQMGEVSAGYWIQPITPGSIVYAVSMAFWGAAMPNNWEPLGVILAVGLLAWLTVGALRRRDWGGLALAWGPLVLVLTISVLWRPVLLFRGLVGLVPAWLALGAVQTLDQPQARRWLAAAAVLPALLAGVFGYYRDIPAMKGDPGETVTAVYQNYTGGPIVIQNDSDVILWAAYAPAAPVYKLVPCGHVPGGLSHQTEAALGVQYIQPEDIPAGALILWGYSPFTQPCEHDQIIGILDQSDYLQTISEDEYTSQTLWLKQR